MLKEYVVCAEEIKGYLYYSIRANTDCSPIRFKVIESFDTFEDADAFIALLLLRDKMM